MSRQLLANLRSPGKIILRFSWLLVFSLSACLPLLQEIELPIISPKTPTPTIAAKPFIERPVYAPGELVEYTVQSGDTLANLAYRFNTTIVEILAENSIIPDDATTLPPNLPMKIPIYYESLWGSQFQIIPNCAFINGPEQIGFDVEEYVESQPGWLKDHQQFAAEQQRSGAEIVSYVAATFSISPKVLLAVLEYQTEALSNPIPPKDIAEYPLGYVQIGYHGLYIQLVWAANTLNQGYYGWLTNHLDALEYLDQTIEHPDPWQNAGTVALQYYFSQIEPKPDFDFTINQAGFLKTYQTYFEDPSSCKPHIPGSLRQPSMQLPFESGRTWAFTGGPHTGWGQGDPWAALDFAPPSEAGGCELTGEWAVAVAPGIIARSDIGLIELDLDADGDPRTGWVVLYLHLGTENKVQEGVMVDTGDNLGHPSCEGGESTGSHVHIARKYNGEWVPATGIIPFDLDGWIAQENVHEYQGTLIRFTEKVISSVDAEEKSLISSARISP